MRSPHLAYLGPAVAENRDDNVLQDKGDIGAVSCREGQGGVRQAPPLPARSLATAKEGTGNHEKHLAEEGGEMRNYEKEKREHEPNCEKLRASDYRGWPSTSSAYDAMFMT